MNVQEIFRMEFEKPFRLEDADGGLFFSNGLMIEDYHEQDWCENVYCDFGQVEELFKTTEFTSLVIEAVVGAGIKINGFFIPCYDEQNGYYSSNLRLEIRFNDKVNKVDITDCSEYVEY